MFIQNHYVLAQEENSNAAENPNWAEIILPALIGAISGSLGGNIVTHWLKQREEKGKLRKELTEKYLLQLQYSIQAFHGRLYNMKERGGDKYMNYITGNDEYYKISTLYSLGSILALHRILLTEGVYSQMEYVYPKFRNLLLTKFDEFGCKLDNIEIKNPETLKPFKGNWLHHYYAAVAFFICIRT